MFGTWRFLLALFVVAYHILGVSGIGPLAVETFFVLSGFLMTMIMHQTYSYTLTGFRTYFINRALRLYPLYWTLLACTVLIILFVGEELAASVNSHIGMPDSAGSWLANLLMLYPEPLPSTYYPRLAPATWALSLEIVFYVAIGLGLSAKLWVTSCWLTASIVWVVLENVETGALGLPYGDLFSASVPFALGSLAWHCRKSVLFLVRKIYVFILMLWLANAAISALAEPLLLEEAWVVEAAASWVNLVLSGAVTVYLSGVSGGRSVRYWDRALGDLSYPVYLFHWSGACLATWLFSNRDNVSDLTIGLLAVLITIIVSILANRWINVNVEMLRAKIRPTSPVTESRL